MTKTDIIVMVSLVILLGGIWAKWSAPGSDQRLNAVEARLDELER